MFERRLTNRVAETEISGQIFLKAMGKRAMEMREDAEIVEPFGLTEVYATGVARAFASYGHVHILYCVDTPNEGRMERVAILKLVIPIEVLAEARRMVDDAVKSAQRMAAGLN